MTAAARERSGSRGAMLAMSCLSVDQTMAKTDCLVLHGCSGRFLQCGTLLGPSAADRCADSDRQAQRGEHAGQVEPEGPVVLAREIGHDVGSDETAAQDEKHHAEAHPARLAHLASIPG